MISGLKLVGIFALGMGILGSMTLPSIADDYRDANSNFIHRGAHGMNFGDQPRLGERGLNPNIRYFSVAPRDGNFHGNRPGFGPYRGSWQLADRNRFFANHPRQLQRLTSGNFYTPRGSGITIQFNNRPDFDRISNDAGASDSFPTAAGTYSVGYSGYREERTTTALAPKAKIIDVARMKDACAYENGVCVIRP